MLPSGGVSVKSGKFNGVKSKTDIYNKEYKTDCEFYTDVLLKNSIPHDSIICEDKSGHPRDNAILPGKYLRWSAFHDGMRAFGMRNRKKMRDESFLMKI